MDIKKAKIGLSVKTPDGRTGVINVINKDYAFIFFGGHQRNSESYTVDSLKEVAKQQSTIPIKN